MTPDAALDPTGEPKPLQPPSTAGMTTRVVKGSMWTLAGQVAPFAVSFISTPFIIRFLGSEAYGVLLLVGLIPMYFSFADFGMGIASTKFASEAYAQGNRDRESQIVWTSVAIAAVSSIIVAVPMFVFSTPIVRALNAPEHLITQASVGLKITSAAFVIGILASVLNSPMLARLRMDLNTVTQAVPKVLLAAVTPIILYFGGGIVEAVSWTFIVGLAAFAVGFYFSGRLLPELFRPRVDPALLRPLLKFGGGWFVAMVAAMLLTNLEKLFLTKIVSVQALAYYSIAFTFANMTTMFVQAIIQSLVPAFSQLQTPDKRREFEALFERSSRLTIIWLLPALTIMFVIARPFFSVWAGEEFGLNSTLPFYVLLIGLFFNLQATIPYISIMSVGRTDVFARLYWIELVLYAFGAFALIIKFGIVGAAAAWSLRVFFDAFLIVYFAKKHADVRFEYRNHFKTLLAAVAVLLLPVLLLIAYGHSYLLVALVLLGMLAYGVIVWKGFIQADEKKWLRQRYRRIHV